MKCRKLGSSGLSVSDLILGTMGFGTETEEKEGHRQSKCTGW